MSDRDDKLGKAFGWLTFAWTAWDRYKAWRKSRSFAKKARAELDAKRTELELDRISDDANRDRGRCEYRFPGGGPRCGRPHGHAGAHRPP